MGKLRLIRETKIAHEIQKTNSSEENQQKYRHLLQSKKGELVKVRDYVE